MQIKFSSKHVQVTDAIEAHASKKIEKFPRYFDRVSQVEVVIDRDKPGYRVEINLAENDDLAALLEDFKKLLVELRWESEP